MTRTFEEKKRVLELWSEGYNKLQIANMMGIPRTTVRDCITQYSNVAQLEQLALEDKLFSPKTRIYEAFDGELQRTYAYLLGLYLGDGCLSPTRSTYKIRITLDTRYPNIIAGCVQAIQTILPYNQVTPFKRKCNCVDVTCYSNEWPELFPQHGEGMKYRRKIQLEQWQQEIVDQYPLEFFKGLYHSDGTRSQNIVKGKDYRRYIFTNMSEDIRQMFIHACELLGLHWTTKTSKRDIMISRREDVAYLDSLIGPKS
ncbi:MAG: hypothetical protein BroJett018_43310 [Chloroflexota bacterium]|nr:hypothetical protein [Chloroflexota bacterium]NOG65616.1 hypothetical protein [Chloroflexota bacterium]GIK66537.1 MAG: hypothetical protein BroJett018_43310 [Chloroflexota bacterium]